jgi:dipeptidyl aminopeptidase/acylaminoacyl peptidase
LTAADAPSSDEERRNKGKDDARVVDENPKHQRLFLVPVSSPPSLQAEMLLLASGDFHVSEGRPGRAAFDWSPDGKTIAFTHTKTPSQDDWASAKLSLVDVETGTIRPLVHSGAATTSPLYSPDGKRIAFLESDTPPTCAGSKSVKVIDADGGPSKPLPETWDGFGRYSELVDWSADGKLLYFTEAKGTNLRLLAMPMEGNPVEISQQAGMSLGGVSLNASRTHFGFGWEQLDQPSEAFVSSVVSFEPIQISQVNAALPKLSSGRTEVIRWKSGDGMEVEGFLTYPAGYDASQRYPLLLVIHGGPTGVFTQTFDGNAGTYPVAVFSSQGYAVLRANVRGSSGYGKAFRYANYGDWGGGDFQDLMAAVDHVIGLGIADPERMGVMGWSYGGYMTAWIITQTKRFRAASVGAGVTNLLSFTGTADIPGFLPDYFAGEFWEKPEVYSKHSPMSHMKGVTTPTLIQHGEKDERVPLSQGQELYNALKRQGCTTKMVVYPRTPHAIEEPKLLLDAMQRNLDWFDLHIPKASPVVSGT